MVLSVKQYHENFSCSSIFEPEMNWMNDQIVEKNVKRYLSLSVIADTYWHISGKYSDTSK